jgi:hypothetical protein
MRRQLARYSVGASRKRGNHSSGTASSRPSASATRDDESSVVTVTAVASNSTGGVAMPCLQKFIAMLDHEHPHLRKFVGAKAVI